MQQTLDISDAADVETLLQSMNIHESSFANLKRGLAQSAVCRFWWLMRKQMQWMVFSDIWTAG